MKKPIVSIFMLVYNHEPYIKDALDGFLMQRCNFDFEIVVGEDCSTDKSREVLLNYAARYPGKFTLLLRETNMGFNKNAELTYKACMGKYIALCEGDDYWTDPYKLQKQVDFMEANPDYNFSMGRVDMLIEKTGKIQKRKEHVNPGKSDFFTLKDYLKGSFSQTSSFLFRNDNLEFPEWFSKVHAGDQSLVVVKTGINGKIKYHSELFSIYRVHNTSITHTANYNVYEKFVETLKIWEIYLEGNYRCIFKINKIKFLCLSKIMTCNSFYCKIIRKVIIKSTNLILKLC